MVERLSNPEPFRIKRDRGKLVHRVTKNEAQAMIWTMIDGEKVRLGDMEPSHRGNCVRMLRRKYGDIVAYSAPIVQAMLLLGIE